MARINPKVDIVFKKLFGSKENEDILLAFVNSLLPEEEQVAKVTIRNPYNLPDYISGKLSILDIKAEDENGTIYDIEMQVTEQGFYGKRALYYWGKTYTGQIDSGEMYSKLRKTIMISILDFDYFREDERYHRIIRPLDIDTKNGYEELDFMELHFLELKKFKTDIKHIKTALERWAIFLSKAYEFDKNNIPEELAGDEAVKSALEKLEIMYLDKEEFELYEAEQKAIWDEKEKVRTALEKGLRKGKAEGLQEGMEKGKAEGLQEGEKKAKLEIAKNLLDVLDNETIAQKTGLTAEEIESLRKK